ncbi:MAG: hypothetical protein AAGK09_10475 [Planctomycetota bacterium]
MPPHLQPDYSFTRNGRTLAEWLPDLVSDDRGKRAEAADAIGGMASGLPAFSTDWSDVEPMPDDEQQLARFEQAVRSAVADSSFPAPLFTRRLLWFRESLHHDWLARVDQMSHLDEKLQVRESDLMERMLHSRTKSERKAASKRFHRLFCAAMARDQRVSESAEAMQAAGLVSAMVVRALDTAFLAADDVLFEAIQGDAIDREALEAIERMGSAARPLADGLIELMDRSTRTRPYDVGPALGAAIRGSGSLIRRVIERLGSTEIQTRLTAARALRYAAPELKDAEKPAIDWLTRSLDDDAMRLEAIRSLASVGRGDRQVLDRILEIAEPRPVKLRKRDMPFDTDEYDETMYERGVAIDSLAYFVDFPHQAIPVLIDALDTFEEYDPDQGYHGEHARACEALQAFGAGAAQAVPWVIAYLDRWLAEPAHQREWPSDKLELLKAIGPAARDALPVLKKVRDIDGNDEDDGESGLDQLIQTLESEVG